jgi:DnaK suppressor protein
MEPEEFEALHTQLVAKRDEIVRLGDERIDPNRVDAVSVPDEDTQPLTEMNQVIASKRNKARIVELERIEAALARMANDPDCFGECLECGEMIPLRRLQVMPWALHCVKCEDRRNPRKRSRRRHIFDYED